MQRPKKKVSFRLIVHSRITTVVLAGVLFAVGWVLLGEIVYKKELDRQVESLQKSIEEAQVKNQELEELLSIISNPDYVEREAKSKLNLRKEGERVFIVNKNTGIKHDSVQERETPQERSKSWLDFLGL